MKKIFILVLSLMTTGLAIAQQGFRNINFNAQEANGAVKITWATLSETNVDRHEVERSVNGIDYRVVGTTAAQNNYNNTSPYNFLDATPNQGWNYYRLRTVSSAGAVIYSDVVRLDMGYRRTGINVYPNPSKGALQLQLNNMAGGRYAVVVYNMAGNQVYNQTMTLSDGSTSEFINLPNSISKGMYVLQLVNNQSRINRNFVIN